MQKCFKICKNESNKLSLYCFLFYAVYVHQVFVCIVVVHIIIMVPLLWMGRKIFYFRSNIEIFYIVKHIKMYKLLFFIIFILFYLAESLKP